MAYVKYKTIEIGDKVKTKMTHSDFVGYFEVGTVVEVIGISERGYDIKDSEGNKMLEIGWEI